ncbi:MULTISPECIES: hypothetical protein [Acidithiobacillus]|jgi:hypothetical protein|uniref:Uncharacterized protein n=1 Tax=Acidithiobacillus thiooxidans ATCC 19377 TaxID=637390 RepID=A0A5P9XUN8_ACITH|nr:MULTISPECIES: hypothetical protein [Acidithiobacillus]MBE7565819.1 hypothetical protein [Acidithiobacillus sp. HP-11]MBU2740380.1 hypothetical protein [Acidithiobacillus albertensis]MBU2752213.1 hypothetical protein [Acidithiobacillus thiooxidans]MBU2793807.1 hypothetical protein [Acidithiobacillus thiooxidans]MBU2836455.1 hypothetical protein [Acidithiobacillus thiooxidans]
MQIPAENQVITQFLAYADELLQALIDLPEIHQEQRQLYLVCLNSLWQMLNNAFQQDGGHFLNEQQIALLQMVDREIQHIESDIPEDFRNQLHLLLRQMNLDLVS